MTTVTLLTVLSGTHLTSTVGVTRYVFLYIIAIKCCCGFSLQLTLTVRFSFDVSAFEMPLHLKQPAGVSVKIQPLVGHASPSAGEIHNRGKTELIYV